MARKLSITDVERQVLQGDLPAEAKVGSLNFAGLNQPINLPEGLEVDHLNLENADGITGLPAGLRVNCLRISKCRNLRTLPPDLQCKEVQAMESGLRDVPSGIRVEFRMDFSGCTELKRLETSGGAKSIHLAGCSALEALPEDIEASFLTVSGCTRLERWPERGRIAIGGLAMRDCPQFNTIPPWMGEISQLNLSGCAGIRKLPETAVVTSWIDIAGTQLTALPPGCQGAALRWRGAYITHRIAFEPESINAQEVLKERNAEMRRVLLDRMGYSRFMAEAHAEVVDGDRDAGGERRLVKVPMEGDEDLVCVMVRCPSTGRDYVIRVPPTMRTCGKAVAWIAGFDDEADYRPLKET